jgi:hypothetical protein
MNVPADAMIELARASGAPVDYRAEGVVRWAASRLTGEREYHLEVLVDEKWEFLGYFTTQAEARFALGMRGGLYSGERLRVVELLRRVLP